MNHCGLSCACVCVCHRRALFRRPNCLVSYKSSMVCSHMHICNNVITCIFIECICLYFYTHVVYVYICISFYVCVYIQACAAYVSSLWVYIYIYIHMYTSV